MKNKHLLPYNYNFYFEPTNPIISIRDFTDELVIYSNINNIDLIILEESLEPVIEIKGEKYICRLGEPFRAFKLIKVPINPNSGRFLGYKWVYIYKC